MPPPKTRRVQFEKASRRGPAKQPLGNFVVHGLLAELSCPARPDGATAAGHFRMFPNISEPTPYISEHVCGTSNTFPTFPHTPPPMSFISVARPPMSEHFRTYPHHAPNVSVVPPLPEARPHRVGGRVVWRKLLGRNTSNKSPARIRRRRRPAIPVGEVGGRRRVVGGEGGQPWYTLASSRYLGGVRKVPGICG